jgi:hypothetical protein
MKKKCVKMFQNFVKVHSVCGAIFWRKFHAGLNNYRGNVSNMGATTVHNRMERVKLNVHGEMVRNLLIFTFLRTVIA